MGLQLKALKARALRRCFQPNMSSQTKSYQNWMKNAVEKIHHWSPLLGQLDGSKISRGHLKLILCCFLPNVIPHVKFNLNWMKNKDFTILEILYPQNFFENSPEA